MIVKVEHHLGEFFLRVPCIVVTTFECLHRVATSREASVEGFASWILPFQISLGQVQRLTLRFEARTRKELEEMKRVVTLPA